MNKLLIFLTFLSLGLFGGSSFGQNGSFRWAVGLGPRLLNYKAHPGQPPLGYSNFDPAGQLTVGRYLSGAFDFRTHLTFSPKVRFPVPEMGAPREAWLLDMSYNLVFKFYNGALLRESARIGPYLMVGVGGSYVQDNPDAYAPLGVGVRIRFNERMNLHLEAVRQLSLNRDHQPLSAAIAFVYNLNDQKPPEEVEPESEEDKLLAEAAPDTDGDGVPDLDDECPDTPGDPNLLGCPPQDSTPGEESIAIFDSSQNEENMAGTDPAQEDVTDGLVVNDLATDDGYPKQQDGFTSVDGFQDQEESFLSDPADEDGFLGPDDDKDFLSNPDPNGQSGTQDGFGGYASEQRPETRPDETGNTPCVSLSEMNLDPVYFAYASDQLTSETKRQLDRIADLMKNCSNTRLVLSGHTDATGSERDNLTLSVMRAFRVKYYLVYTHGIRQSRITSNGMGEAKPIANNSNEFARQKNRRVAFELIF